MGKKETKEHKAGTPQTSELQKEGAEEQPVDLEKMDKDYLMVRLKEKEKEASDNYEKYLRAVAELENYKKRASKERSEAIKYGQENLLKDILPLVDNLERASGQACNADNIEAFKNGLKLIQDQLLSCLERHGVERIDCVGRDFDPHVHEAMLQVDSEEHEENKVIHEFEKGYLLHGRLLRPSRVSVSKRTKQ
jgi:molecular chaperone GrpE